MGAMYHEKNTGVKSKEDRANDCLGIIAQKLGKASQRKLILSFITKDREESKLQKKSKKDIFGRGSSVYNGIDPSWYDYLKNDNFPRLLG